MIRHLSKVFDDDQEMKTLMALKYSTILEHLLCASYNEIVVTKL